MAYDDCNAIAESTRFRLDEFLTQIATTTFSNSSLGGIREAVKIYTTMLHNITNSFPTAWFEWNNKSSLNSAIKEHRVCTDSPVEGHRARCKVPGRSTGSNEDDLNSRETSVILAMYIPSCHCEHFGSTGCSQGV
jgi:hypothetical protein